MDVFSIYGCLRTVHICAAVLGLVVFWLPLWWYKHMEFMLRTGIAFHTAFAVFVLTPWLGRLGSGTWALAPWLLPAAVGIPGICLWVRHYRRKFAELP